MPDPVMDVDWLPAWLLLVEPGLAKVLKREPLDTTRGWPAMRTLHCAACGGAPA